jgi:hypothetical protein
MLRPLIQSAALLRDVRVAIIVLGSHAAPSVGEQLRPRFRIHSERGAATDAPPKYALTPLEIRLLDQLVVDKDVLRTSPKTLPDYLTKVAQLGGYLARAGDSPPGNMVMWRGLSRLTDIEIGYLLRSKMGTYDTR